MNNDKNPNKPSLKPELQFQYITYPIGMINKQYPIPQYLHYRCNYNSTYYTSSNRNIQHQYDNTSCTILAKEIAFLCCCFVVEEEITK